MSSFIELCLGPRLASFWPRILEKNPRDDSFCDSRILAKWKYFTKTKHWSAARKFKFQSELLERLRESSIQSDELPLGTKINISTVHSFRIGRTYSSVLIPNTTLSFNKPDLKTKTRKKWFPFQFHHQLMQCKLLWLTREFRMNPMIPSTESKHSLSVW